MKNYGLGRTACTDPGLLPEGVQARLPENSSDDFFSPQFKHFYSGLSMFYLIEIIIFQISEGVQHFFFFFLGGGGSNIFQGGQGSRSV